MARTRASTSLGTERSAVPVLRRLQGAGFTGLITAMSSELASRYPEAVFGIYCERGQDVDVLAAARAACVLARPVARLERRDLAPWRHHKRLRVTTRTDGPEERLSASCWRRSAAQPRRQRGLKVALAA